MVLMNAVPAAGRVAQVVKYLPSKHEALSSAPSTSKEKKKRTNAMQCLAHILAYIVEGAQA
jgi:hypothetical protein